jgi:hypothetical protein
MASARITQQEWFSDDVGKPRIQAMANEARIKELSSAAVALARKIEIFESRNTKDMGGWISVAAERRYKAMQQELDKLDNELERLGVN